MSELIEVVFENVPKVKVPKLLLCLIQSAKSMVSADVSEDIKLLEDGGLNIQGVESLVEFSGGVTALMKLEQMDVGGIILPLILLRLVKYGDIYDIDFNFDLAEVNNVSMPELIKVLHKKVTGLAQDNGVESWFAGMEPASDEETRYFTNDKLGPLK